MTVPRASVHALGALLVAAVVAGGLVLVVVPLSNEIAASSAETARTAEANLVSERQIVSLTERSAELADLEASVAGLRHQIPAEPRLDEVFTTVAAAAREAGTGIVTALAADASAWGPGKWQVGFSVTITAPTLIHAQQFLDELHASSRLIAVTHASATAGAHGYDVTVDAVAFVLPAP